MGRRIKNKELKKNFKTFNESFSTTTQCRRETMSQYKTESFYNTERKSIERWMPKNGTIQKGNYAAIQAGNTPQYRRDYLNICGRIFTSDAFLRGRQ